MPKLPDYTAVTNVALRNPIPERVELPTSPVGAALKTFGGAVQQFAGSLEKEDSDAEKFDTQRRLIEFDGNWSRYVEEQAGNVEPGAPGFADRMRGEYQEKAREFFKTVPNRLKPDYDVRLTRIEDNIATRATK